MLENALAYAKERGWPVFPVNPETCKPHVAGGFHAATLDPREIRYWWSRKWPAATIATPTGLTFTVLDIDRHDVDGFETLRERGYELSPTLVTGDADAQAAGGVGALPGLLEGSVICVITRNRRTAGFNCPVVDRVEALDGDNASGGGQA